ncbi:MAG: hypothetical protein ACOYJO_00295 [Eubacterium sp.]|jgi:hypothetical protein
MDFVYGLALPFKAAFSFRQNRSFATGDMQSTIHFLPLAICKAHSFFAAGDMQRAIHFLPQAICKAPFIFCRWRYANSHSHCRDTSAEAGCFCRELYVGNFMII